MYTVQARGCAANLGRGVTWTGVLYAATDPWPDHPKPWFRDVYKIARGHGWTFKKSPRTHWSRTAPTYGSDAGIG